MSDQAGGELAAQGQGDGSNSNSQPPSAELMQQWIESQNRQAEVKAKEFELLKQQDDHSFAFAMRSLEVKEADNHGQRKHDQRMKLYFCLLVLLIVVVVAVLIGYAFHANKDAAAMELIKNISLVVTGAIGGYGTAKVTGSKPKESASSGDAS